jgi:hypothetical protein
MRFLFNFSNLVPVLNQVRKMEKKLEKKVFLGICPGLSKFLDQNFKKNFICAGSTPDKKSREKISNMIFSGSKYGVVR